MDQHQETAQAILKALRSTPDCALFVTELQARLRQFDQQVIETALTSMDGTELLIVHHGSPDPHLRGDFRIAALLGGQGLHGAAAADVVWRGWLREFLMHHRCG